MRETVALELSFVNSNLQLLKEQLAELNSSVELYQVSEIFHKIIINKKYEIFLITSYGAKLEIFKL